MILQVLPSARSTDASSRGVSILKKMSRFMSDSDRDLLRMGGHFEHPTDGCPKIFFVTLLPQEADRAKKKAAKICTLLGWTHGSDRFTIVWNRWVITHLFRGRNQPTYIGVKGHLVTKYQQDIPVIFQSYLLR